MSWNAGSIGSAALNMIENVPTTISGAISTIVAGKCQKVINYTGEAVSSSGFDDKFFPTILYYTIAEMTSLIELSGVDASSIHLGDFSKSMGGESNLNVVAKKYEELGDKELQTLGMNITTYQTFYG